VFNPDRDLVMNERIKQITGQVLDELVPETWVALGYDKIKEIQNRTAELIVRECIDIIAPYTVRMSRPGEEYLHPIQEIKQHFGVKE
jgi:hypothetical protein